MAAHPDSRTDCPPGTGSKASQWPYCVELAWRDLLHEWKISACLVLALVSVLTPLLVLFGLKSGLIHTMSERLRSDPANLQVIVKGNNRITPALQEAIAGRGETGFLVPRTRTLSATLHLLGPGERAVPSVDMIPTAPGDPLLGPRRASPEGLGDVILTHTIAGKLGVSSGDTVRGVARRRHKGTSQALSVDLAVVDVLPETALGRDAAFVSVAFLDAVEDYRDQFRVPSLGVEDGDSPPEGSRTYAGVRLYASTLDGVAPLATWIRAQGFDVLTRARDIETVRALDRTLGFIFLVIASVGVTGFLLSLAASLWGNVDRKRRDLAMLRLVGLRTPWIMAFPAIQAAMLAGFGTSLSLLLYAGISTIFNTVLAENLRGDEFVSHLPLGSAIVAVAATLGCALASAAFAAYRSTRIDPADCLREL